MYGTYITNQQFYSIIISVPNYIYNKKLKKMIHLQDIKNIDFV